MAKMWVVERKHLTLALVSAFVLAALALWLFGSDNALPAGAKAEEARVIHMVAGEFSSTTKDGKKLEAYRWDPGTVYVQKGDNVQLRIYGVNGESHPFVIEGMHIKGEVKKGEETVVEFKADRKGIYRIVCLTHADIAHHGPMIGYIVVE